MKTKILFLIIAFSGMLFLSGCEDTLDVTENFIYELEVKVFSEDHTFSHAVLVDMKNEQDLIKKYGDKIKNIQIEEVKYWLTEFDGSETQQIVQATLSVLNENDDVTVITTVKDQLLQPLVNTPTKLDINQEGIDKMASLIENSPHQFKLSFTSTVNETPLNFTLKFSFNIKMTANPL
ncbi:MAG TPA: hypothetical protein PK345_06550 [Bacteroidales bacterium]|jgi:hypothetical protein|nr:hypothetical protein [Bacteroidales bacterium]MBP7874709.1 hypothetical protein [Bacteroidales bacterium]MCZ2281854.1 hypothetical protein [Bacteroidales bacterium]HPX34708.1 hypothetical protein [Bacteroidales bacterium]HQB48240.1 hypothetical protein [Bacteroidales bacterium]